MTAIETRFPISNEKGNVKLSFPWTDAFRPSKKTSQANVHFEKASVLFNVAAVMSQAALQVERGTAEGATQACKIFQVQCGTMATRQPPLPSPPLPPPVHLLRPPTLHTPPAAAAAPPAPLPPPVMPASGVVVCMLLSL
jgi:hypothetical protein